MDGNEPHFETDAARGASTPNIVRWILLVSLFAAIALLSIVWITGAATQSEDEATVSHEVRDRADVEATDSIVGEDADELETAFASLRTRAAGGTCSTNRSASSSKSSA